MKAYDGTSTHANPVLRKARDRISIQVLLAAAGRNMSSFPRAADDDDSGNQASNTSVCRREKVPASGSSKTRGAGGKQFKCEYCDRLFSTRGNKMRHVQATHNPAGAKMYPCETCGKEFKRKEDLTMHIRVHTGEKPYACSHAQCGRRFARISDLRSHERIHSADSKPFACEFCGKRFTRRHDLKKHHLNIHSQTPSSSAKSKKVKSSPNGSEADASSAGSADKAIACAGKPKWSRMGQAAGRTGVEAEVAALSVPRKKRQRVAISAEPIPPQMKALPTFANSLYSDGLACTSQQKLQVDVERQQQQQQRQQQQQQQQHQVRQEQPWHEHNQQQHGPQQEQTPGTLGRTGSLLAMPLTVTVPPPSSSMPPPPPPPSSSDSVQAKPGAQTPRRIHHKRVRCDAHKHCEPAAVATEGFKFAGGKSLAKGPGGSSVGDLIKQLTDKDRPELAKKEGLGHAKAHVHAKLHVHGAACGHVAVLHENHVDFLVEGGQLECYDGKEKTRQGWVSSTTDGSGAVNAECDCDGTTSESKKKDAVKETSGKPSTRNDLVHWDGARPDQPRGRCEGETHGPQCGHDVIHHDGHLDYLINGRLMHPVQGDRLATAVGGGETSGEAADGSMLFEDHGSIRALDDDFVTFWSSLDVLSETADEAVVSWCDMCCSDGWNPSSPALSSTASPAAPVDNAQPATPQKE